MGPVSRLLAVLVLPLIASCSTIGAVEKNGSLSCGGNVLKADLQTSCDGSRVARKTTSGQIPAEVELCSSGKKSAGCSFSSATRESVCNVTDILNGKKNAVVPDLVFPVDGGCLSSPFGYRRGIFHSGLDITAAKGEPVAACAEGRVVFTGSRKGYRSYGMTVLLDHGRDCYTHYAHLSRILVRKGQKVAAGDRIGLVGSTGRSTSPHLHLEVKVRNQLYNPLAYFPRKELKRIDVAKTFSETPMGPVSSRRKLSTRH
ncbi:MAG TPA: M23 family metallopeptidase [Desulfomonilaceae bacterium]|nr:M23 family metallopeptidase [Desulfomonilaceae bacterium]